MKNVKRFQDEKYSISHFNDEVWVCCPVCKKKATCATHYKTETARLLCASCSYNKEVPCSIGNFNGTKLALAAPNTYFKAELWLTANYRGQTLFAFNGKHLDYLEKYIAANLRESIDRTGFTMVERLPKFMQIARNRLPLLKIISKLRNK